jgi:hypothetical protein
MRRAAEDQGNCFVCRSVGAPEIRFGRSCRCHSVPRQGTSRAHIRLLLGQTRLGTADLDVLATQLTAALDGPLLLYLSSAILNGTAPQVSERLGQGWQDLARRDTREQ